MQFSPDVERVIRDAAAAQRAYWTLIAGAEDPRFKLELMDRRIRIDAELRGDRVTLAPAIDMNLTVAQNVEQRLEAMRATVELEVIRRRAIKRLGGCGLSQLTLSYIAEVRRKLRRILDDSGLSVGEFAAAIGVASRTIERHLAGDPIPHERKLWYRRIESVHVNERGILFVLCRPPRTRARAKRRRVG